MPYNNDDLQTFINFWDDRFHAAKVEWHRFRLVARLVLGISMIVLLWAAIFATPAFVPVFVSVGLVLLGVESHFNHCITGSNQLAFALIRGKQCLVAGGEPDAAARNILARTEDLICVYAVPMRLPKIAVSMPSSNDAPKKTAKGVSKDTPKKTGKGPKK
jgi:hypothetical protein